MVGSKSYCSPREPLENIVQLLFKASIAPATAATYSRMLSDYEQFCKVQFPDVPMFPSTNNMISQFIAKLFLKNPSPSTTFQQEVLYIKLIISLIQQIILL